MSNERQRAERRQAHVKFKISATVPTQHVKAEREELIFFSSDLSFEKDIELENMHACT